MIAIHLHISSWPNHCIRGRHWLERLLQLLIFISPFEQDASTMTQSWADLMRNEEYRFVRSSLEELLYFRIKVAKEWKEKSNFSSLLEQLHVAAEFGMIRSLGGQSLSDLSRYKRSRPSISSDMSQVADRIESIYARTFRSSNLPPVGEFPSLRP